MTGSYYVTLLKFLNVFLICLTFLLNSQPLKRYCKSAINLLLMSALEKFALEFSEI